MDWIDSDIEKLTIEETATRNSLFAVEGSIASKKEERNEFDESDNGKTLKKLVTYRKSLEKKLDMIERQQVQRADNELVVAQLNSQKLSVETEIKTTHENIKQPKQHRDQIVSGLETLKKKRKTTKEQLQEFRRARKRNEDGIEKLIADIYHDYHIEREAYHGGDFNGVCIRRWMAQAEDILKRISTLLKAEKREDSVSDEVIDERTDAYAVLLTCLDGAFSVLRSKNPGLAEVETATASIQSSMNRWRSMGLSVTPKAHVLESHAVHCLKSSIPYGGLSEMLEDFVELSHQEDARLERQFQSIPNYERKHAAMHRAEEARTHPGVVQVRAEMDKKKQGMKRQRTKDRAVTMKVEGDEKRSKAVNKTI